MLNEGYSSIGLLLRLARFKKACRRLPKLQIPEHVQRVIDSKMLNNTYGNERVKRAKRASKSQHVFVEPQGQAHRR